MQALQQTDPHHQRLARGLLWGAFSVVLVIVIGVGVWRLQQKSTLKFSLEDALRPLGSVPDFTLQERSGAVVTKDVLLGKVWIAAFIFTQCAEECPLMSNRMARLQEIFATEPDLRLVSITLDPEHDTLAVLSQYAQSLGAHEEHWLFLTGEKATIFRLAREGFHLGVVDPRATQLQQRIPSVVLSYLARTPRLFGLSVSWAHHDANEPSRSQQPLLHSARFVLVDRQGQIRQYYDSRDVDAMHRLQQHVRHLLRS